MSSTQTLGEPLRLGVFRRMADVLPQGKSGRAEIDHFDITPDTWQGFGEERIRPGRYARLKLGGATMMSDTDMELRTNYNAVRNAKGDVLIGGLGIGCITLPILLKPDVSNVTVIELDPHVVALVEPAIVSAANLIQPGAGDKLAVHVANINTWRPERKGRQFDSVYFDIWFDMCVDNVDQMKELHAAFRRYVRGGGTVNSWEYERLAYLKKRGRWR